KNGGGEAQLWLACMVGPLGVWLRWFLAGLNEIGIGGGFLKWFPFGTLFANVSASCIMAALATLKKSFSGFKLWNLDLLISSPLMSLSSRTELSTQDIS
ncbi:CrcB-like protein, partial [Trifolium medium]|nr:CrcB-like protein [Trifolium medium]